MTRRDDWWGFHTTIDPIDTPTALQAALADPRQRWYGLRRVNALAATGALTGASAWNPNIHPRGRDGKFIEKYGWVRWLDPKTLKWSKGWVSDIDAGSGKITVRDMHGLPHEFPNAKNLVAQMKPKARLDLPDPTDPTKQVAKFKKVGGQGGSNPGGLYEIDGSFANNPPEIGKGSNVFASLRTVRQAGSDNQYPANWDTSADASTLIPPDLNVVVVPRVDGTKNQYEVLQRLGTGQWFRVPASGQMTSDDLLRPDLEVSPNDAFGEPGSIRRQQVIGDLGTVAITRGASFDVNDVADMIQQNASPLPKVGDRYYVKKMNIPERPRNEALANDYYELLGVPVPEVAVGGDGLTISSKLVGDTIPFNPNNPDHVLAVQTGFVADAWLSNWDVVGQSFDNLQIDADGRAWRIDAGGALQYRAMGKPKGGMFGPSVGELSSLRDSKINPTAGKVFSGLSNADLAHQATVLQSITPDQIQALADKHDLPELGPVMIARRKSILDQLGIVDPPPEDLLPPAPPPTTVFNPVEAVQQMGTPPTVGVHNWNVSYNALPSTPLFDTDWGDPDYVLNNAVFKKDGDLWTYASDYEDVGAGGHAGMFRNVFTGDRKRLTIYDGQDETLQDYTPDNVDTLAENATPTRDLAVAEIVARTNGVPLADLTSFNVNTDDDPEAMRYADIGIGNFNALQIAWERGRLGPTGPEGAADRPLRGDDNSVWEITALGPDGVKLRRRDTTEDIEATLDPASFNGSGPWFMPSNDTTAAVWKSKYAPTAAPGDGGGWQDGDVVTGPDGVSYTILKQQNNYLNLQDQEGHVYTVHESFLTGGEPDDDTDIPELDTPGQDDGSDLSEMEPPALAPDVLAQQQGLAEPPTVDAELEALIAKEEAIAAHGPTQSVKIVNGVHAGLAPGEPYQSSEFAVTDLDQIKADLLGKPVVVLPADAYENPDFVGDLGTANGLGTVSDVITQEMYFKGHYDANDNYVKGSYQEIVRLKIAWPEGNTFSWVNGGEQSQFQKVVIPVGQDAVAQQTTFKTNGDILVNGTKVGTWAKNDDYWNPGYTGVIDGDHSLTGNPMHFKSEKQYKAKQGAAHLVVPITPKPTKPKSTKVQATEDEIKKLNDDLVGLQAQIAVTEEQLADLAKAKPVGGVPLGDGHVPAKGDWVFSTKDGTWAQIKQTELKFGEKHKQNPANFVRVEITQPDGTKKTTLRSRNTLVLTAGPGEQPFVMQTKAVMTSSGDWIGPGVEVTHHAGGPGSSATVLDTTTDGKVKILYPDGSQKWIGLGQVSYSLKPTTTVKQPPSTASADDLNAHLATLNDQHAKLAAAIANTTLAKPKKKKDVGVPFPGPDGKTIIQSKGLAEAREAKGLKNMKDGYVPTPGMILRHNDGTQYVVWETGDDWSTHKNSVRVVPVGPSMSVWDAKWRAVSTMVVDHDAMLTDADGLPLPIITSIDGLDDTWAPNAGLVLKKDFTKHYSTTDPTTGKSLYRDKTVSKFYIVDQYGAIWNMNGTKASTNAIQPGMPLERVGYIDTSAQGGKKLTVSIQQHHAASVGELQYAVIHDPNEPAGIPLAQQTSPSVTPSGVPTATPSSPTPPPTPTAPTPTPTTPTPPTATEVTPTTPELPVFTGKDPKGTEVPHPPVTASTAGVPAYQAQGGTPTLDVAGVPKAKSVMSAIAATQDQVAENKQSGHPVMISNYGLADHDVIEDMLVHTQVVRDKKGDDYIEVEFRVEYKSAQTNYKTFITSATNQAGDWDTNNRNAKNMVPGDQVAVRIATGGGKAPKGALRPDENGNMPNATVVAAPVLIGKNSDGTLDVYRTQVITANGDTGFVDLEDRNGEDTIVTFYWDPAKPRTSSGATGLNPNAAADGWKVRRQGLGWERDASGQTDERNSDGTKPIGGTNYVNVGNGYTLERDYQGGYVEYQTSAQRNSNNGKVVIRVPADDPDAHRKISEMMELVGVSKEKQQPPDRDALVQMAATKVFEQFHGTWSKDMSANSAQQALDAIDKAVGAKLGRPATMADISLRVGDDGRISVLVSEDVSKAIVATNGIKSYKHIFTASDKTSFIIGTLSGENAGLMATTERWKNGLYYSGKSSVADHGHDSADHMFVTMAKSATTSSDRSLIIDPVMLHRQTSYYWRTGDSFGSRDSNQLNWLHPPGSLQSDNELMLQRKLEPELWGRVALDAASRKKVIDTLHARGITTAPNGMLLEDFITEGSANLQGTTAVFGDEIPLDSLPAGVPALAGV